MILHLYLFLQHKIGDYLLNIGTIIIIAIQHTCTIAQDVYAVDRHLRIIWSVTHVCFLMIVAHEDEDIDQ